MTEQVAFDWFDQAETLKILEQRERELARLEREKAEQEAKTREKLEKRMEPTPCDDPPPLSHRTERWYATLPKHIRPTALRCAFPHVLDRLCAAWETPRMVRDVIDDLLIDDRGGRSGFPFPAVQEIHRLRDFYFEVLFPDAERLMMPRRPPMNNRMR